MLYEYICSECRHSWEQEQSIKDDPLKNCPKCKNDTAKRIISPGANFILKDGGVGWAKNRYSGK